MDSIRRGKPSSQPLFGAAVAVAFLGSTGSLAQTAPRSFEASPDVYKVVAEDARFRVIEATWKPGQRDNWHSHGAFTAVYNITDCHTRGRTPDGNVTDNQRKAGQARIGPQSASHSIENVGRKDCKVVIFEPK